MSARLQITTIVTIVLAGGAFYLWSSSGENKGTSSQQNNALSAREKELQETRLDPEKQKEIWAAEHYTFEIEKVFGKSFVPSLLERRAKELAIHFRDDFEAHVVSEEKQKRIAIDSIEEHRQKTKSTTTRKKLNAKAFVEHLMNEVHRFSEISRHRFRVLKIERDTTNPNRWKTHILFSLHGRDPQKNIQTYISKQQVDFLITDEKTVASDPVLESWTVLSQSSRKSPSPLMTEATKKYGLDRLKIVDNWDLAMTEIPKAQRPGKPNLKDVELYRIQTAVADFDRDGYLDIAIATLEGNPILLRSEKGKKFTDVTSQFRLRHWPQERNYGKFAAAWIDFDNDGYPDLVMGNRLYRNHHGKRFEDITESSGLEIDRECMGCLVADYNGDGLLDLYLLYQNDLDAARSASGSETPIRQQWVNETETGRENQLWRNEGNGQFLNVTLASNSGGGRRHTHAAVWFHYDLDRFPDLYIANDFGKNVVLRNRGDGTFEDVSVSSGTSGYATSMGVAAGDINNDGKSDLYVANMYSKMGRRIIGMVSETDYPEGIYEQILGSCAGNRLYSWNSETNKYREIGEKFGVNEVGWAYGPLLFDLQNDGWLDIYATTGLVSFNREEPDG